MKHCTTLDEFLAGDHMRYRHYPNRTLCDVLADMRKCYESRNFAYLPALVEEAQWMGNRMEAALSDARDIESLTEERSRLKRLVTELETQAREAGATKEQLDGDDDL